jgi:hypoxanthine phosphoribosyltransferase
MTGAGKPVVDVLIPEDVIAERVTGLAKDIAHACPEDLLIVVILKGSFVFAADLLRALDRAGARPQVDFMTLSSYGDGMRSSGTVTLSRDISEDVTGRHVLIVDDILESGRTLLFARDLLSGRSAESVKTCLLLDKASKRQAPIEADFIGFEISDQFVVGYGLDLAHHYRGLPYIGVVRDG